ARNRVPGPRARNLNQDGRPASSSRFDANAPAIGGDQLAGNGEADAAASLPIRLLGAPCTIGPIEALEDVWQVLCRNPSAFVRNANLGGLRGRREADADAPARRRVLDG